MKKVQYLMAVVMAILPFFQAQAQLEYFSSPQIFVPLENGKLFYVQSDLNPVADYYTASGALFLNPGETEESKMVQTGYKNIRITHDFNNDGLEDFISTENSNLQLVINNNNESFSATIFTMPCDNSKIISEDFDDDGDFDFIVGNCADAGSTIYSNNGMGSFTTSSGLDYMAHGRYIDFDMDGIKDWLIFNSLVYETSWLKGLGNNTFDSPITIPYLILVPDVKLIDYDNDGDMDALDESGSMYDPINVLTNENDIFITSGPMEYGMPGFSYQSNARIIDIDNDNDLDVLQLGLLDNLDGTSTRVLFIENLGDNIFSPPVSLEPFHNNITDVFVDDVNLDGWQDFVMVTGTGVQYNYINNNGTLDNIEVAHFVHNPAEIQFRRDDNDLIKDAVLNYDEPASNEAGISLVRQKTDLSNGAPLVVYTPEQYFSQDLYPNYGPSSLITGLVNEDNWIDMVDASYYYTSIQANSIPYCKGSESGFDQPVDLSQIDPYLFHPLDFVDLDQDGDDDLIANSYVNQALWIFWSYGGALEEIAMGISPAGEYKGSYDFDQNGLADMIHGSSIFFQNSITLFTSVASGINGAVKCVADFTGDGYPEIISVVGNNTMIHHNNNGVIAPAIQLFSFVPSHCMAIDANGDGNNDLVCSNGTNLEVRINAGNGNFDAAQIIESELNTTYLTKADWDNDGDEDIFFCADYLTGQDGVYWLQTQAAPAMNIGGTVFYDENQNSVFDSGDYPLAGVAVNNPETGSTAFSNSLGKYAFNVYSSGDYTIESETPTNMLAVTPVSESVPLNEINNPITGIDFGFYPENALVMIDAQVQASNVVCNSLSPVWISLENSGTTFTGINTALTLPAGVIYSSAYPEPTSISGQVLTWDTDLMTPFSYASIGVMVIYPGVEEMGNLFEFTVNAVSTEDNTVVDTDMYSEELLCAYDPNDKTEFTGHTAMGYVSGEEPLEYIIRFQNTGNYVATDVRIEDQLNANLDRSTFEIVASSHAMEVMIDENGKSIFMFNDIMLPDSATDQAGSNGFVRFRITPVEGLAHGNTIENTGQIYFDNNPPIITNTTLNTIYDCSTFDANVIWSTDVICGVQGAQANVDEQWIESIEWLVDGSFYSDASGIEVTNITSDISIDLHISNALCGSVNSSVVINTEESELPQITPSQASFCEGQEVTLSSNFSTNNNWYLNGNLVSQEQNIIIEAGGNYELVIIGEDCEMTAEPVEITVFEVPVIGPLSISGNLISAENISGVTYQWFFNDQPIAGANQSSYTATESGNYSVQITTANDCSTMGAALFVQVGLDELNAAGFIAYPNPVSDVLTIRFADGGAAQSVRIFNALGQVVYQNNNLASEQKMIDVSGFASGTYTLEIQQNDKKMKALVLVK
jgi:hypothetical protein